MAMRLEWQTFNHYMIEDSSCVSNRFISIPKPENPVYNLVSSRIYKSQSNYTLRPKSLTNHATDTNRFGDFVTNCKHARALNRNTLAIL